MLKHLRNNLDIKLAMISSLLLAAVLTVVSIMLLITVVASCSAAPITDVVDSPASLNQRRLIMNGEVGLTTNASALKVRTYTSGTVSVRGLGGCGFYEGYGYKGTSYTFDLRRTPNKPVCVYSVELRDNLLDAPMSGILINRQFITPDVRPLKLTVNGTTSSGVGHVQLAESDDKITEDHTVLLHPTGANGTVYVTGCGISANFDSNEFDISSLYDLKKDCLFDILVNSDDVPYKESASLFVGVYKKGGAFLDAPTTRTAAFKRRCFEFQDRYAIITIVNGERKSCVRQTANGLYTVEGLTSRGRLFYGAYKAGEGWQWIR